MKVCCNLLNYLIFNPASLTTEEIKKKADSMYADKLACLQKNRPKSKIDSGLLWWRWRQPKLRFGCCFATFAFICPFCFAKDGLCGFDYRKKQTQIENRFRSVMVEMAVIETASENQFPRISTSVVYLLRFPSRNADKQAFLYGIL